MHIRTHTNIDSKNNNKIHLVSGDECIADIDVPPIAML